MVDLFQDRRTRSVLFILRLIATVFFVSIFGGIPIILRASEGFDPFFLWDFSVPGAPGIVSFLLLGVAIYGAVILHELIHAAVLWLHGAKELTFRVTRLAPRVSAPGVHLRRGSFFLYAAVPFMTVSVIGIVFLLTLPLEWIAWAFLPTVANGIYSAADFVVLAWAIGVPPEAVIAIVPEGALATHP